MLCEWHVGSCSVVDGGQVQGKLYYSREGISGGQSAEVDKTVIKTDINTNIQHAVHH